MPARDTRDLSRQSHMKARRPTEGRDFDTHRGQLRGPLTGLVQTADRHRNAIVQSANQLDDEAFGAAGIELQDNLEDPRRLEGRNSFCVSQGFPPAFKDA